MTTTDAPVGERPSEPAVVRLRRRRVLVGGGAVLALGVAAAAAWVLVPEPLSAGSYASRVVVTDAPPSAPGDFEAAFDDADVTEVTNSHGTDRLVTVGDGRYLDVIVSVTNDGLLPVRITDVSTALTEDGPVRVLGDVEVTVPVTDDGSDHSWRPLGDGVVVEPGWSHQLRLVGRFDTACGSPAPPMGTVSALLTDQFLDLRYEVLGVSRTARPTVSWTLGFEGAIGCGR